MIRPQLLEQRTVRIALATEEARKAAETFEHFDANGIGPLNQRDIADFNRAALRLAKATIELGEVLQLANADAIAKWWQE